MTKPVILWYDIDNYEICVYDNGHVDIKSKHIRNKGNLLSQWYTSDGYLRTKLDSKTRTVHSIVAEYFHGKRPVGFVINHKDGNKLNNHPTNLEYCTQKQNIEHAINMGLHISVDPTKMPTYKDGRTYDKKSYKKAHYEANKEVYVRRARAYYLANKEHADALAKIRRKEKINAQ